jgi:hypothetical protein
MVIALGHVYAAAASQAHDARKASKQSNAAPTVDYKKERASP